MEEVKDILEKLDNFMADYAMLKDSKAGDKFLFELRDYIIETQQELEDLKHHKKLHQIAYENWQECEKVLKALKNKVKKLNSIILDKEVKNEGTE